MRTAAAVLAFAACLSPAFAEEDGRACPTCGKAAYGTTIRWEGSPSQAAAKARAQEKLVFVLHVSGYFENPAFT